MLNRRGALWSIFGIFFVLSVTSIALGQSISDTASGNPIPPELRLTIINEIRALGDKMRDHVDQSENQTRKDMDDKFSKLNDKFSELDKEIAVLNNAKWYISIIIAPISVYCTILLIQMLLKSSNNRKIEATSKDTLPQEDIDTRGKYADNTEPGYQTAGGES